MTFQLGMAAVGLLAVPTWALAGGDEAARFQKEFPPAAARLEEQFARVKGTCRVWNLEPGESKPSRIDDGTFAIDGGFEKVVVNRCLDNGSVRQCAEIVYCVGKDSVFCLARMPDAKEYTVEGIGSTAGDRAAYLALFGRFVHASTGVNGRSFSQVMAGPGFRVLNAERVIRDGHSLVRVEYEFGSREPKDTVAVVFDPDAGWVVRSSEYRPGIAPQMGYTTEIEYGPPREGVIPPLRVVFRDARGATSHCEFTSWSFDPTDGSEFTMARYGLPDLVGNKSQRNHAMTFWILGAAAVLFVAAFGLWRLSVRARRPV
jgi:hypothetical protein